MSHHRPPLMSGPGYVPGAFPSNPFALVPHVAANDYCEDAQGVNVVGVGRGLVPPTRLMFGRGYRGPDSRSGNASVPMIPPPPPPEDETGSERQTPPGTKTPSSLPSIKVVKNDYNQHFVDTGERPQNFIRDYEPHVRFTEYPKLGRLIRLKDELNRQRAHPPMHIQADLRTFDWNSLGCSFDVVLIDPPWREYAERAATLASVLTEDVTPWTLDDIIKYIKVDQITEIPSFCFIWCGTSHLDEGRKLLQTWGYRRCEDICWCKTNLSSSRVEHRRLHLMDDHGLFQRTKEHCLMGVKGVVRRSTDTHFIHSNIDTDIIVAEEPTDAHGHPTGSTAKPAELYEVIDRFCLGRRKLELFGLDRNIRPGWLTIGQEVSVTNFDKDRYVSWVSDPPPGTELDTLFPGSANSTCKTSDALLMSKRGRYVGSTPEIDQLRPKSPPRNTTRPNGSSNA